MDDERVRLWVKISNVCSSKRDKSFFIAVIFLLYRRGIVAETIIECLLDIPSYGYVCFKGVYIP